MLWRRQSIVWCHLLFTSDLPINYWHSKNCEKSKYTNEIKFIRALHLTIEYRWWVPNANCRLSCAPDACSKTTFNYLFLCIIFILHQQSTHRLLLFLFFLLLCRRPIRCTQIIFFLFPHYYDWCNCREHIRVGSILIDRKEKFNISFVFSFWFCDLFSSS